MLNSLSAAFAARGCVSAGEPQCVPQTTARGRCGLRFGRNRRLRLRADFGKERVKMSIFYARPPSSPFAFFHLGTHCVLEVPRELLV